MCAERGVCAKLLQLCPTLCDPTDCSLPGSSVLGIFQAKTLEWVAISFSGGSSQPRDWTCISCLVRQVLYHWVTREALCPPWASQMALTVTNSPASAGKLRDAGLILGSRVYRLRRRRRKKNLQEDNFKYLESGSIRLKGFNNLSISLCAFKM